VRRWPCTSQEKSPHQSLTMWNPDHGIITSRNVRSADYLRHPVVALCYDRLGSVRQLPHLHQEFSVFYAWALWSSLTEFASDFLDAGIFAIAHSLSTVLVTVQKHGTCFLLNICLC
jgi:hypothetical protein